MTDRPREAAAILANPNTMTATRTGTGAARHHLDRKRGALAGYRNPIPLLPTPTLSDLKTGMLPTQRRAAGHTVNLADAVLELLDQFDCEDDRGDEP